MRDLTQSAVQIFRSYPDADADEILNRIMETGVERRMAVQLVLLVPLAYGHVLRSDTGVLFANAYGIPLLRELH